MVFNKYTLSMYVLCIVSLTYFLSPLHLEAQHIEQGSKDRSPARSSGGNPAEEQSIRSSPLVSKKEVPLQAGYIRLRPKQEKENDVFHVDFGDNRSVNGTIEDEKRMPLFKLEKIDDFDTRNSVVRKELTKNYKTEVSMGLKVLPFSEVYLCKGFLVPRNDQFNLDPHDDGWRLKFRFSF